MNRLTRRRLLSAVLCLLVLAGAAGVARRDLASLDAAIGLPAPLVYRVAAGASLGRVAADLFALGVLPHPRIWAWYGRWNGLAARVKAGEYQIVPGLTPRGLLDKMVRGDVLLHGFTIVDGWRVEDLLAALRKDPQIVPTLPSAPADLMQKLGRPGLAAEGQFLPETYKFPSGTTDLDLLRQAHQALQRTLEADWAARAPDLPLHDPYELLIVASIVEKESSVPGELGLIAGLYLHRLAIGMRLQADPTLIYGLGERYDGSLHAADLRSDGPYNTYTRAGLPPTPIALPSAAALHAVAQPQRTDALYFVASDKSDGSHIFSATLEAQNAAVARYVAHQRSVERARARAASGSAP
jgi:UPF0755 protein